MLIAHIIVYGRKDRYLKQWIEIGHIDEAGYEEYRGTGVVRQYVGVLHERQTLLAERLTEVLRHRGRLGPLALHATEESLEMRRVFLLLTAPANVEGMEEIVPEVFAGTDGERTPLALGQRIEKMLLLSSTIELTTLLAFDKIQMYLSVVIGQLALASMPVESGKGAQQQNDPAPRSIGEGNGLVPQTDDNGKVTEEIPHVAGQAIEHTANGSLMVGETSHLTVGGVAEIGQ